MQHTPSTIVEYIWIGGNGEIRSKTRVLYDIITTDISEIPDWNFDGSSTSQASGTTSELIIKPRKAFINPFKTNNAIEKIKRSLFLLVICDVYNTDGTPHKTNTRDFANKIFEMKKDEEPWFGIEQEYFLIGDGDHDELKKETKQGPYYCSSGYTRAFHRKVAEEHLHACLIAGIKISGINAEVAPCQWEYQIGPVTGIKAGDHLIVSRWLMERIAEKHQIHVCWDPKPFKQLNGSGCHTNFSTKGMREEGGLDLIISSIEKLRDAHVEHMCVYGKGNQLRMTGKHESSSYKLFSFDIKKPVDRGASVRISYDTINKKCGYFEDRRPASNMDPYLVTSQLFKTICLSK